MWQALGPWLAGGGGVGIAGAISWLVYRLHRDAIESERRVAESERRRADDHRAIADYERQRADHWEGRFGIMLGRASERL